MSAPDFSILRQRTDLAERPRALAQGHYIGEITAHSFGQSKQKGTPFVRFTIKILEETVDIEDGANEGMDITRREVSRDFYLTDASMYRLADMLDAVLGKAEGRTYEERIPETRGARVVVQVTQRPSPDGKEMYNDVGTIVAAD